VSIEEIETINDHLVSTNGDTITILMPPMGPITKEQALRLAAWLAAMADPMGDRFEAVRAAIANT
jgi:argininosuccinate lyase